MKGLFWLTLLFALAVGIALAAHYNEGYLLLVWPPYRVDLTLNLAIALVGGLFVVLYALLRAIALALALPRRVREYREKRSGEKAGEALRAIIRLLGEGRYAEVLRTAGAAYAAGCAPALATQLANGDDAAAIGLLEAQLERDWNPLLVAVYGRLAGGDASARIARAERWLAAHGDEPQLQLALGRLQLAAGQAGLARAHLETALSLAEGRTIQGEVRLELARLSEQQGLAGAVPAIARVPAGFS